MENLLSSNWNMYRGAGEGELTKPVPGFVVNSAMVTPTAFHQEEPFVGLVSLMLNASRSGGYTADTSLVVLPSTQYSVRAWVLSNQPGLRCLAMGWKEGGENVDRHVLLDVTIVPTGEWQVIDTILTTQEDTKYLSPSWGLFGYEGEGYLLNSPIMVASPIMVLGGPENLPSYEAAPSDIGEIVSLATTGIIMIGFIGAITKMAK